MAVGRNCFGHQALPGPDADGRFHFRPGAANRVGPGPSGNGQLNGPHGDSIESRGIDSHSIPHNQLTRRQTFPIDLTSESGEAHPSILPSRRRAAHDRRRITQRTTLTFEIAHVNIEDRRPVGGSMAPLFADSFGRS
jgi:hypothetical protein